MIQYVVVMVVVCVHKLYTPTCLQKAYERHLWLVFVTIFQSKTVKTPRMGLQGWNSEP